MSGTTVVQPSSVTLKASASDMTSIMIDDPAKVSLSDVRQRVAEWLKQTDQFLNRAGAPVPQSDEKYPVASFVTDATLSVKRFVEPSQPTPTEPGSFTVKRGTLESQGVKIGADARLKDLREQLAGFMKPEYYFMDTAGGRVTLEDKYRASEIAEKGIIQIGPQGGTPKPISLPTTEVPAVTVRAVEFDGAGGHAEHPPDHVDPRDHADDPVAPGLLSDRRYQEEAATVQDPWPGPRLHRQVGPEGSVRPVLALPRLVCAERCGAGRVHACGGRHAPAMGGGDPRGFRDAQARHQPGGDERILERCDGPDGTAAEIDIHQGSGRIRKGDHLGNSCSRRTRRKKDHSDVEQPRPAAHQKV